MKRLILTILCVATLMGITVSLTHFKAAETRGLNFAEPTKQAQSSNSGITFAVAMLLGIVCGHLYRSMESAQADISTTGLIKQLRSGSLWRSLLASPIVFGIVYSAAGKQPDFVLACVFAFENGFLCPVILKGKLQPQEEKIASADGPSSGQS